MGRRITDVTSAEFDALFTGFEHTAYRLETLQAYDVSYEEEPYRAFLAGHPQPRDPAKSQWVSMIGDAVRAGKVFQRVHVVREPLTDYLRYELGWSYPPNVEAGEEIRILVAQAGGWPMSARGEILPERLAAVESVENRDAQAAPRRGRHSRMGRRSRCHA